MDLHATSEAAFERILEGDLQGLQRMLEAGLAANAKGSGGTSLLKYAAGEPNPELVRFLLEHGAGVNDADNRGFTPLHVAAGHWCIEVTQMLLEGGADVRARSTLGGLSVLHGAADAVTVRLLCERGADPNARDAAGNTPLHWARWDDGSPEVIAALLACGADPALRNARGLLSEDTPPDDWMDHCFRSGV